MKLAKIYLNELSFGTHMICTEGHWNGFVLPFIKEDDMSKFAQDVNNAFFECSDSYDLLEEVDGKWVWNGYLIEGDKTTLEFTTPISSFDRDGVTYYDIQIGHTWEVEEGA